MSLPRLPPALAKLGALALASVAAIACTRAPGAPALASLRGRIHHDSALLLLPTVGWRADARRLLVDPGTTARLLLDVRTPSDQPLLLRFEPMRPSRTAPLAAALDGGAL